MDRKRCSKCRGEPKPLNEFRQDKNGRLNNRCKKCVADGAKAWRQQKAKDPEWRKQESKRVLRYYNDKKELQNV